MKILYLNSRSIKNKIDEVEMIAFEEGADIILATETWVNKSEEKYYNLNNYNSVFATREKRGGGAGIFVKNNLNFEIIEKIENEISIKIKLPPLIICGIYRPPSVNSNYFLNMFDQILENLSIFKMDCIVIGDMNINILRNDNDKNELIDIYMANNFKLCNLDVSTRDTNKGASLIDHVLCNFDKNVDIKMFTSQISDHKLQVVEIKTENNKKDRKYKDIILKKFDAEKLKIKLIQLNSKKSDFLNPNMLYEDLLNIFEQCSSDQSIRILQKSKPWFSKELRKMLKLRDKYYYKLKKYPGHSEYKEIHKNYNKLVKKTIRNVKQNYYNEQFINSNQKTIWNTINKLLTNKSNNEKQAIDYLLVNNVKIEEQWQICEKINNHFVNVGEDLSSKIPNIPNTSSDQPNEISMFLDVEGICNKDIEDIIDGFDVKKASGFDNINIKIIKLVKNEIIPILLCLTKLSFKTGIFPDKLKIAKITPIFKNGKRYNCNDYRPISVLPVISKIIEKIMNDKLSNFLENKNLLFSGQYGFRPSRDTEIAVADVITKIQTNVDNNKKCCMLSLDLCKAFDTVNHRKLLQCLYNIGVRGIVYCWFENYLYNRKQFVQIENNKSNKKTITCGVPQGSVLGPIMFLIYINSIGNLNLKGNIKLFADDTTIIYFSDNILQLENDIKYDLNIVFKWLQLYKLTLNFNKSTYMLISKKNSNKQLISKLIFNSQIINYSKTVKFLGLYLDENLSWKYHIQNLRTKISPLIGILYKIRHFVPLKYLKNIYFCLIYSKIQYLISIWGSAYRTNLTPLKKLQNKVIKCIHNLPSLEPTINLYQPRGYLDLKNIYKLKISVLIQSINFQIKNSDIKLLKSISIHQHETRQCNDFQIAKIKSNFGKRSILHEGINIYNKLPTFLKNIREIKKFKNKLTKIILEE